MFTLLLAAFLQATSGDISIAQAEAYARRDEASLHGELSSQLSEKQGKAIGRSLINCGVTNTSQVAGIMVVMKLDEQGRVDLARY